jgi:hypothetical protein
MKVFAVAADEGSLAAGALGAKLLRNIAIPIIRPKRGQGAD